MSVCSRRDLEGLRSPGGDLGVRKGGSGRVVKIRLYLRFVYSSVANDMLGL